MKNLFFLFCILIYIPALSQDMTKFSLYKPAEDAEREIANATQKAKKEGKHVFIQIGGNWCVWCARFEDFITTDRQIDSLINANYVVYHLNYSKENYNEKLLAKYGFPQRFGFPVFLVLDSDGKQLHIQNSVYLEQGKSYNRTAVINFFYDWMPRALDSSQYKNF